MSNIFAPVFYWSYLKYIYKHSSNWMKSIKVHPLPWATHILHLPGARVCLWVESQIHSHWPTVTSDAPHYCFRFYNTNIKNRKCYLPLAQLWTFQGPCGMKCWQQGLELLHKAILFMLLTKMKVVVFYLGFCHSRVEKHLITSSARGKKGDEEVVMQLSGKCLYVVPAPQVTFPYLVYWL